ncbi:N-6 DNA methylase [Azospirillum sp.]|uniref:class I SAM-dependent DNA methyltransferase n=1 Tax=Azospirillum sp. TaxID=34012 RepID=UPI00260DF61B|nr:N-6 DNA methylase [Azospirillum sp.]
MARQPRQKEQTQTSAQRLDSIIKSARKHMRKDRGLNTDLERLPTLVWIMFLKFLDDKERIEEEKAILSGVPFKPAIARPYRWRDWAAKSEGITGPDLIRFLNDEKAILPGSEDEGPGLFAYLRGLRNGGSGKDRRDVIANAFRTINNRAESGYVLREVINLIDGIHFTSSEEMQILGRLYETLLREIRDAAGQSGEFYTPRPLVRFMVRVVDPRLGETVLDPACGTGGFLTEAFEHLAAQCRTVAHRKTLQTASLFGGEVKSLPYMLAEMGLLLHGLEAPQIDPENGLRHRLTDIGEADRVNVILTNPPFGGEEEKGILNNFPEDKRSQETTLLFMQMIMRRLKKAGKGRAAVVVPNGALFGDGVAARIKADLIENYNLHTVVRLPEGVFAPYTDIPANLIFFDTSGPTKDIWFYDHPLPPDRRKYTKTNALTFEEFDPCLSWWSNREENERAWKVDGPGLIQRDADGNVIACNLDLKNPNAADALDHRPPAELVDSLLAHERRILDILTEIKATLAEPL